MFVSRCAAAAESRRNTVVAAVVLLILAVELMDEELDFVRRLASRA